jgi:oxygen-independent coproporphyrinogen-3 oxidase
MAALIGKLRAHFTLRDDDRGEYSIEIDPREATPDSVAGLRRLGFNRMSLGVQDFDPRVQEAVNRIQSEDETVTVFRAARANGFRSISVDLIYGLPLQTADSFARTVQKIIDLDPDRVSVFNYAHLPDIFKPQRRIHVEDLPTPPEKLDILQRTSAMLAAAGYVYIGMDHFAKPDDELAVAQRGGTLYRNFQGYSTHADCDLIGLGSTSISMVGPTYAQNERTLEEYYARIDAGDVAVFRGVELDADDRVRRAVITQLICNFRLDYAAIERAHGIRFADYFATEVAELPQMASDGLIRQSTGGIEVLPAGRLLIRNVCMVFDKYLRQQTQQRFSKVI